jgi:aquaporin Z
VILTWRDSIPDGVRDDPAVHTRFEGTFLFNRAREPELVIRDNATTTHWPEYLMEAVGLGIYMMSACTFALLLSHPSSPALTWIPDATTRRILMGIGLGAAVAAFIYSPWGMQSGAHLNPAVTLTFFRLGKVAPRDMVFYSLFQALGGITGVLIVSIIFGRLLAHPAVNYAVTVPGRQGMLVAFLAETMISFNQMTAILWFSNSQRLARFTGCIAAALIAINISTVAPLSGMSMNPARSVASAVPAVVWSGLWIYLTAPPLAMLLAAEVYVAIRRHAYVRCAKLHHDNDKRCIFCDYRARRPRVRQR